MSKIKSMDMERLIYDSLKEYYSLFGSKKNVLYKIRKDFSVKEGELNKSLQLKINKKLIAVIFYYNYDEIKIRSISSFLSLKNKKSLNKIKNYSKKIQILKISNSIYISRFSVNQKYLGKGFGSLILKKLIRIAIKKKKKSITLHVNKNNYKAIKFYKKNKFKFLKKDNSFTYNLMILNL